MKRMEFVLRRDFKEKSGLIIVAFFLFLIPPHFWRIIVSLILFSYLLPKDVEDGKESLLLSLPLKRWEIFLYDFFIGTTILLIAGFITVGVLKMNVTSVFRLLLAFPFIYGVSMISSTAGKGNFGIPLLILILDMAFSWSWWRYVSPLYQGSVIGAVISILVFVLSLIYFNKEGKMW